MKNRQTFTQNGMDKLEKVRPLNAASPGKKEHDERRRTE
jgi:hypothetical protein